MIKWVHLKSKHCVSGIGYKYSLFTGKTETIPVQWKIVIFFFFYSAFNLKKGRGTVSGTVTLEPYYVITFLFVWWSLITLGVQEGQKPR